MNRPSVLYGVPAPDFARHDPATGLSSIFRPVARGRRPQGLDVTHGFDGLSLRFTCYEWLDARDQSVLLAACALAGISSSELTAGSSGQVGQQLWLDLEPTAKAQFDKAVVVTTSFYQLRDAAGLTDNSAAGYERLKDSLYRLSQVGCRAKKDGYDWSMRMLSYAARPDGGIDIALNGRFAGALAGQHIRTSLEERRSLSTELAELTHCYLTAWIREGHKQKVGVDKLSGKIWGVESANPETTRKRRERMREALELIGKLPGWSAQIDGRGEKSMALIERELSKRLGGR